MRILAAIAAALAVTALPAGIAYVVSSRVVRGGPLHAAAKVEVGVLDGGTTPLRPDGGERVKGSGHADAGSLDGGGPGAGASKAEEHRRALALAGSKAATGQIKVEYFIGQTVDNGWQLPRVLPAFFGEVQNLSKGRSFSGVGVTVFFLDDRGEALFEVPRRPVGFNLAECGFGRQVVNPYTSPCGPLGPGGIRRFVIGVLDTKKWTNRVEVYVTDAD